MTTLSSFIESIVAYLPYILIGLVVVAIVVMIAVILLTQTSIKKAIQKKVPPPSAKKQEIPPPIHEGKTPPMGGRLSQFLTLKGYFRVGDMSLGLLKALELLRQRLDTVDYKYHLPWYALIGPEQSGKTTLMTRSDFVFPLGMPDFGGTQSNPGIRWCFLNGGVVLDIKGRFFMKAQSPRADEKEWRTLLSLLGRYRSKKPIDGLILTIPATELYGKNKLTPDQITERAKFMAQKLIATQNLLGLRLPIYIVITKTDIVPGFQSTCQSIPIGNRSNMLGWTAPYHPNTAYSSSWIDEAFAYVQQNLNDLRMEILAHDTPIETRDGVFVFPSELMRLIPAIKTYMDQIFKLTTYEESLLLRGIYFTGDYGNALIQTPDDTPSPAQQKTDETQDSSSVIELQVGTMESDPLILRNIQIFFFQDLVQKKIFKEYNLARPIHHRLVSANRNLNLAKIGLASFIGIGTFGIINTYGKLVQSRDHLLPILGKINTTLHQITHSPTGINLLNNITFDDQSRQFLEMMHSLNRARFFSIFLPSSWFSPLNKNLEASLRVSYDQIILRTIYMDLLLKARELLSLRPQPNDITISLATQLHPTATVEYALFTGFLEKFIELSQYIDQYNRLGQSYDPELLESLVLYTLGIQLPKEFIDNYTRFQDVLQELSYPTIDLMPYQATAQETLYILYQHFISNLLSSHTRNSISHKLNYILNEFGARTKESLPDLAPLRKIADDLNISISKLGNPGDTWMDKPYFDPGTDFTQLMNRISNFKFFGPKLVQDFANITGNLFHAFQNELLRLNRILIERPLLNSTQDVFPSEGVIALQHALALLFNQPFMAEPTNEMFNPIIPENQVIFWNSKLIDMATESVRAYQDFIAKNLQDFPPIVRETLRQSIRHNLQKNIVSLIARAQTFTTIPDDTSSGAVAEEVILNKIEDVREISPKFIELLQTMSEGGIGTGFVELRDMLGTLSTRLLQQVDTLLDSYRLYQVRDNSFSWWNGQSSPILEGFSVGDIPELKSYLAQQRQLIRRLAVDYAAPMVLFLSADIMREFQGNTLLLNRWKRLYDQINQYEKKTPDNTLIQLENILSEDLAKLTLNSCLTRIPLSDIRYDSRDFFSNRRVEMMRNLRARCEVLKRTESIDNYTKLAAFFNEHLKDKFPFIHTEKSNAIEADPDDIREFFQLYAQAGKTPQEALEQVHQLGNDANGALRFLTEMDHVKKFFGPYLMTENEASGYDVPLFDFSVEFRVNRDKEIAANMINDFAISPDNLSIISNHMKDNIGTWRYGDPFTLSLNWANVSPTKPYSDAKQPYLQVKDNSAQITYPGHWSLLWFIRQQQAAVGELRTLRDGTPYVLKVSIPNGPSQNTVFYMRLSILEASQDGKPGKAMRIPTFPVQAPLLPDSIREVAQEPVLVNQAAEAIDPLEQVDRTR